jgi:AsmA protein
LSGGGEFRTGRTPYERLNVSLKITDGIAHLEDARMEGTAVGLTLTGSAAVPARELDLRGTASLLSAAAGGTSAAPAFELPFMVQGSWDDPIMLPDPLSRIQRSGAAAPLLDAIRERAHRNGARSPPAGQTPALAGSSTAADRPDADEAPAAQTEPAAERRDSRQKKR